MKKMLLILCCILLATPFVYADQLAYLSKEDAQRAATYIESVKKIGLFCGCCDNQEIEIIKPKGVEVKFTGYEQYYEVYLQYSYQGELKSTPLDLAYTWVKIKGELKTIGQVLGLDHDPCKSPNW
jgi:hypothetical protein